MKDARINKKTWLSFFKLPTTSKRRKNNYANIKAWLKLVHENQ